MRFSLGRCAAILAGAAVMVVCSCEKHHVGEIPEVQKEQPDPAKEAKEGSQKEIQSGETRNPSTPPAAPTPAEFFSPTKP